MTNSVWYLVSAIFWHEKVRQFMNFDCGYVSSILYLFITVTNVCNGHQYLINIPQQSKHYWEKEIFESKSVNIYLNLPYTFSPVLSSFFLSITATFCLKSKLLLFKVRFSIYNTLDFNERKWNEEKNNTVVVFLQPERKTSSWLLELVFPFSIITWKTKSSCLF